MFKSIDDATDLSAAWEQTTLYDNQGVRERPKAKPLGQHLHFTEAENEHLRTLLRTYLESRGWSSRAAAAQMCVSQQSISAFLRGYMRAGTTLLGGVQRVTGLTKDQLLGRQPEALQILSNRMLPGWDDAVTEAKKLPMYQKVSAAAFEAVGDSIWRIPPKVDPYVIGGLAWSFYQGCLEES